MAGFAHSLLLLLLPLAPLAGWLGVRRRPALRYPSLALVQGLPRGRARRAVWGAFALRTLGAGGLVLAAAGPRTPDLRTRLPAAGVAVVLVLDVSGSMGEPDFGRGPDGNPVSRLDAAKAALRLFALGGDAAGGKLPGRPNDQLGLVAFAAVPRTACPLTLNHSVLLAVADGLEPTAGVDAGTNLGDALAEGLLRVDAAGDRRKVLVVLSDGEQNADRTGAAAPFKPRQAAQLAANLGVPVHCIDCGGEPGGEAEQAKQRRDGRATLDAVAGLTGGRSFAADDPAGLRDALRQIDALETAPADSFRFRRYHDHGPGCGLAGLGLLAVGGLLEATRWRRKP